MKIFFVLGAMLMFMTACSTIGNESIRDKDLVAQVKAGHTTKEEVKTLFGDPSKVTYTDTEEEIWDYMCAKSQVRAASFIPIVGLVAGGADMQSYTLTVRFRQDGIVKNVGSGSMTGGGGSLMD